MRFAFYGRVSTEDQQDPAASRSWQLRRALQLIEPAGGHVVEEFFDIGMSRSLPWKRRPEATRLLAALKDPGRGFDAIVIGEPARAFYGGQFGNTFPVFTHYGVELWVPEVGGAVDPGSEAHDMVLSIFGSMSRGERNRIKIRVRAAMASQAATEGRFLGGRPPYGYRLVDAGPHPNPGKAAVGQRAHRLDLDPATAPIVQRIFENYVAGAGLYAIAEDLTRDGIPSPSAADPERNRHRVSSRGAWSKSATRAILQNPRYTGRQVWNRQRRDETDLVDVEDPAMGFKAKMKWNDRSEWIWSAGQAHEPIITPELFAAAQEQRAAGRNRPVVARPRRDAHPGYALRGLLHCGICGRRMQGNTAKGRRLYRCRYPAEYAQTRELDHPKQVYVAESRIVAELDRWIATLFDPANLDETCEQLAAATREPDDAGSAKIDAARRKLADCDARLGRYRHALDGGADPTVVSAWIAEVQGEKLGAQRVIAEAPRRESSAAEIRLLLEEVGDVRAALEQGEGTAKAELYAALGLTMTFHVAEQLVAVVALPATGGLKSVSEGRHKT